MILGFGSCKPFAFSSFPAFSPSPAPSSSNLLLPNQASNGGIRLSSLISSLQVPSRYLPPLNVHCLQVTTSIKTSQMYTDLPFFLSQNSGISGPLSLMECDRSTKNCWNSRFQVEEKRWDFIESQNHFR